MAHPAPFDREQLDRELQDLLRADQQAVSHALYCELCDSRDVALRALALAGWDELDWLADQARRRGDHA